MPRPGPRAPWRRPSGRRKRRAAGPPSAEVAVAAAEDTAHPRSPLAALMKAAVALPLLRIPAKAGAAEVNEVGFTLLGYKERGLMKVTEPIAWMKGKVGDDWDVQVSG